LKATFNYTNRIDLDRKDFEAAILETEQGRSLQLTWVNLPVEELAGTSLVVEVYSGGEEYRFPIDLKPETAKSNTITIPINEIRSAVPRLRIKFIDTTHLARPMIRAVLDNLRPSMSEQPGSIRSLLPIEKKEDLKVAWQLVFDNSVPILQVCSANELSDWLFKKSLVKALVFPQVVERIAEWLFTLSESESEDETPQLWAKFLKNLGASKPEPNSDYESYLLEVREEALKAANNYSTNFNSLRELQTAMNDEEQ
jgi:hypothetical protein